VQFKTLKPFSVPKLVRFPGVPKSTERPIHGLYSNKNYIITNAIDNILKGNSFYIECLLIVSAKGIKKGN